MNPLIADELQLVEEEMKIFKITSAKEIAENRWSRVKKLKVGDTSDVDCLTGSSVAASRSIESSPKTTPGRQRAREEEGD